MQLYPQVISPISAFAHSYTVLLPVPVILNWGSLPNRSLSMGLATQSYFLYHVPPSVNLLASLPTTEQPLLPVDVGGWDEEVSHQRSGWFKGPVLQSLLPHWPWPLRLSLNHWGLRSWFKVCMHFIAKNVYLHLCDSHSTVSLIQLEKYLWHNQQIENQWRNSECQRWIWKDFPETEQTDTASVIENKRKWLKRWRALQWCVRSRNETDGYCFYLTYHCTTRSFKPLEK